MQNNLQQLNILGYPFLSGYNYKINTKDKKTGQTSDTTWTAYHTQDDSSKVFNPNNGRAPNTNIGSSLIYVGKWNFYSDVSF